MTLLVPLLVAFAVVVIAGGSLHRRGRWSRRAYLLWVVASALFCVAVAALVFVPRSSMP